MNLKETLLRGIYAYGFEKPSAIQQRAIIPCIKGIQMKCMIGLFILEWNDALPSFGTYPKMGIIFYTDHSILRFPLITSLQMHCQLWGTHFVVDSVYILLWLSFFPLESLPYILIPLPLPSGYDVIAQAQSGTGKTATFAISILQQLDIEQKETQALVLAPTRELAQQVCCSWGHNNLSSVSDLGSILRTLIQTIRYHLFKNFIKFSILKSILLWLVQSLSMAALV